MATSDVSKGRAKLQEALEKTLSSPKVGRLVNNAINDLSSPKGLSLKTVLLGAKFVLANPVNTYNLAKLANSSNIYLDPNFQKSLLDNSSIWELLKNNADNLPKIGQILAKAGFREFQEGNFLDQKGLNILKESFKNDRVLEKLQEITVETRQDAPEWNKITTKTIDMLATGHNFQKFFTEKGNDIANYIEVGVKEILPSDYIKAFDAILQEPKNKQKYAEVQKVFDRNPALKQLIAENINSYNDIKDFKKLSEKKKAALEGFLEDAKVQAKPFLKEYFESYNIDPKILSTVPSLLNEFSKIKEIFDSLNNPKQRVMVAVEKVLEMTKDNKELRNFLAQNKEFLPNVALGVMKNTPNLQKMTEDYNLDKQMLDIVGELMSKPEVAHNIIAEVNKQNYKGVASELIIALNDTSFKLKDVLLEQSKTGLFDNLIKGVLEQDEKSGGAIKKQLENYGLKAEDVIKLTSVVPLLLDKPKSLEKVWNGFVKGNYMAITKELITLTKHNPEIKQYLNDNKEIFAGILDKGLAEVAGMKELDKKGLYSILPSMLNHPNELIKIIDGVESKSLTGMATAATALYSLVRKTNNFEGQITNLVTTGVKMAYNYAVNNAPQPVTDNKITDTNILIDQAVDELWLQAQANGVKNLPDKKKFIEEIKTLYKKNPELENYIVEKLSSKPINGVGDISTPKTNRYSHAADYTNSPIQILNPLYESLVNKQDIKTGLLANMLSEKISQNLFKEGKNRGEDFYMINQTLKQTISEYVKENPHSINHFLKSENQEILTNNIANTLKNKSQYTWAGLATGGIYLPKEIFNGELKDNFKNEFKNNLHSNILAEAKHIAVNLNNVTTIDKANSFSNIPAISNKNRKNTIKIN